MEDRQKRIEQVADQITTACGDKLRSLGIYGSAVAGDFLEKKSDYNFFLIADPVDIELLDRLSAHTKKWREWRVPIPLPFTPAFIEEARDSYPLEFLAMKASYRILVGTDPLAELEIEKPHVRLECERELRSKLLLLRRVYVESQGDREFLTRVIVEAVPALTAVFRGLLFLSDDPWNQHGESFWSAMAENHGVPRDLMEHLVAVRRGTDELSRKEARDDFSVLLPLLERLAGEVDRW